MLLKDRLKQSRANARKTQAEVAEYVGMSQPAYQALEAGRNSKSAFLPAIARFLNVDVHWLQAGQGDMQPSQIPKRDGIPIDQVKDLSGREKVLVPFYPHIAGSCGGGRLVEAYEKTSEYKEIGKDILNDYGVSPTDVKAFPAEGNSMMPVIMPNAIVYVDIGKQRIVDGKIYAICHGGLFKFKQLYNLPKQGIRMVSTNFEEYPEEKLTREELIDQEFEVVGYAFYIEGRLP